MPVTASDIDLTTLQDVKTWAGVTQDTSDTVIQACITAFSRWVMRYTGVVSFTSIDIYTDILDGSGSDLMFTRNRPIKQVQQVLVNGQNQQISNGYDQSGIIITSNDCAISFRQGAGGALINTNTYGSWNWFGKYFPKGRGNILIKYLAGYDDVPEDLELTARRVCAINYKRTLWIDLVSKMQAVSGGQETVMKFRDWDMPPEDWNTLRNFRRIAPVG